MRIPLPERRRGGTEEMLPLINIVFLLIVFFLATGHVAIGPSAQATALQSRVLTAATAASRPAAVIALDAGGSARWDGRRLDGTALAAAAIDWARRHPGEGLAVQADPKTSADRVVEVFTELQNAGVGEVRLLAQSPR